MSGKMNKLGLKSAWRKVQRGADSVEKVASRHSQVFFQNKIENLKDIRGSVAIWLGLLGLIIVAVFVQTAIYGLNYQAEAGSRGGVYAEGIVGDITSFNPILASSEDEKAISKLVYSSLLRFDDTNNLKGDVADSWLVSPDGLDYRVKIRDNIYWHGSNDKLTIDDVIFTTQLIQNPAVGSPLYDTWRSIKVEKIDDQTASFSLRSPLASFPLALTFGVLSKQELCDIKLADVREYLSEHVVRGSGPYEYRSSSTAQSGNKIVYFTPNRKFYGGEPNISSIHIETFGQDDNAINGYNRGEINVATGLSLISARRVAESGSQDIMATPLDNGVFALFNTDSAVTSDRAVRQALRLAIDRDVLRVDSRVGANVPVALETPITPGIYGSVDSVIQPIANPGEAAKMLDSSGWVAGRDGVRENSGRPLTLKVVTVKDSDYELAAKNLVSQWQSIGVDAKLTLAEPGDFQQNFLIPRNYDVLVYQLQLGADADESAYWSSTGARAQGLNFSNYTSPVADLALARGRTLMDNSAREAQYKIFVDAWLDDAPAIALYQSNLYSLRSDKIRTFDPGLALPSETERYRDVADWTVNTTMVNKTP
jgi:peptide/nickel transport system substrate-binding protein